MLALCTFLKHNKKLTKVNVTEIFDSILRNKIGEKMNRSLAELCQLEHY